MKILNYHFKKRLSCPPFSAYFIVLPDPISSAWRNILSGFIYINVIEIFTLLQSFQCSVLVHVIGIILVRKSYFSSILLQHTQKNHDFLTQQTICKIYRRKCVYLHITTYLNILRNFVEVILMLENEVRRGIFCRGKNTQLPLDQDKFPMRFRGAQAKAWVFQIFFTSLIASTILKPEKSVIKIIFVQIFWLKMLFYKLFSSFKIVGAIKGESLKVN